MILAGLLIQSGTYLMTGICFAALYEFETLRELIEKKKEPMKPVRYKIYDK
jgi:hypothetical protein